MTSEKRLREEIILLGRFLYERSFLFATAGNISARLKKEILITPKGKCKGELSPKEISKISLEGKVISGQPSSEWRMHLAVYKKREDISAVIHAHPLWATLLSFFGKKLKRKIGSNLAEMRFVPYFPSGSEELAMGMAKAVTQNPRCDTFILKRHGVVVLGKDLREARFKLERLEFFSFLSLMIISLTHQNK